MRSQDVDEEFVILFMVSDENQSHYLQTNIDTFGGDPDDAVSWRPKRNRHQQVCNPPYAKHITHWLNAW